MVGSEFFLWMSMDYSRFFSGYEFFYRSFSHWVFASKYSQAGEGDSCVRFLFEADRAKVFVCLCVCTSVRVCVLVFNVQCEGSGRCWVERRTPLRRLTQENDEKRYIIHVGWKEIERKRDRKTEKERKEAAERERARWRCGRTDENDISRPRSWNISPTCSPKYGVLMSFTAFSWTVPGSAGI